MTKAEKITLLNTLHNKVVDWDCAGNECIHVTIELDDEARHVLNQIGVDDQYIEVNQVECSDGTFVIDLAQVGFGICGAKYWHTKHGFLEQSYENPDAVPDTLDEEESA